MSAALIADAIVVVHLLFIVFVGAGGALVIVDRRWAWAHLPAVLWGAYAEFTATICPLTPLENAFRARAGVAGYGEDFVAHYLVPLIYPAGLAPAHQRWIGAGVVAINLAAYALAVRRARRGRTAYDGGTRRTS